LPILSLDGQREDARDRFFARWETRETTTADGQGQQPDSVGRQPGEETMNRFLALLGAACIAGTYAAPVAAAYPEKAITVIVPFAAGGGTDVGSRMWAQQLEKCLGGGQPVIVQNRPGAGGQIGFTEVAKAAPDGYTLVSLVQPNVQVGVITKTNSGYTMDSFEWLANFYASRTTLAVQKTSQITSIKQLIDEAKKGGKTIDVGISGIGSDDHQLILKLKKASGANFKIVPFGDASGIQTALLGGHTPMATLNIVSVSKYPDQLRAVAVASENPVDDLPGVKTFRQEGFNIVNGSTHAIGAPKGIAKEARDRLTGCFDKMGKDQAFLDELKKRAFLITIMNPEQTRKFADEEYEMLKGIWATDPWE